MNRPLNFDAPRGLHGEIAALQEKINEAYRVANAVSALVGPNAIAVQQLRSTITQAEESLWLLTRPVRAA